MFTLEDQITRAVVLLRKPRRTREFDAKIAAVVVLGLTVGATAVLSGPDAAAILALAITVTSKYNTELGRLAAGAAMGFVAGLAKTLQSYSDGDRPAPRTIIANISVSMIFATVGLLVADGFDLNPKMALGAAFISGIMTFGILRLVEAKFSK